MYEGQQPADTAQQSANSNQQTAGATPSGEEKKDNGSVDAEFKEVK
jgi:hypothetical protein